MVRTVHKNDYGAAKLPTLFLDLDGSSRVKKAAAQLDKPLIEAEASSLMSALSDGLKRNTIYHTACNEKTLYEKVHELQAAETYFRLGINLPSEKTELVKQLLPYDISIVLASDRQETQWFRHFLESYNFPVYIDPWFQPFLVKKYRELHEEREETIRELHLNIEKIRTILSDAELRIFEKIIEGKSNRRIAEESFLAVATVNNHVSHLTRKMGANDRTHTIKRAIEKDWIRIS
ncbi:response regulator transcription factor [Salibacterium halotolerans]|uniref:Regulatory protein, luxR family n=1 Tax=Salibacterium halotolerans TaxID=1884432 RepID=A0A1I5WYV0_9BACI|nr:LuxR C-terminal-related transcriptional regulator [Salibacterium halotolerans]SFQ24850.1 regulatory protein, luxR family [Salibacterium halotolerans]